MTTRALLFDSPFLLGFDHTRALIERAAKAAGESYPPYNVEARGERGVRITLAVAGGIGIGMVESLTAGYISSEVKDVATYSLLLIYLLIRGGVFARGRTVPAFAESR